MPSKRTNDSVDRILQELSVQQTAAGVSETVTDHQIDEILRSVGISSAPLNDASVASDNLVFAELEDTPAPAPRPAAPTQPAPRRTAPQPAAQTPVSQPAAPRQTVPPRQPAAPSHTGGDTTNTSIIKGFLVKMAPEGGAAGAEALNEGKNQFQKFFRESAAVIPDEMGRIRETGKKKRGWFGFKRAEETEQFVPINVALSTPHAQEDAPADAAPAQEYFPDAEPAPEPAPAPTPKMESNPTPDTRHESTSLWDMFPRAQPAASSPMDEPPVQPEDTRDVWHSKYTRPAKPAAPAQTLEMLRTSLADAAKKNDPGATGTVYRKKRNTVEFILHQKVSAPPAPRYPAGEPAGEPISPPDTTGFTQQLGVSAPGSDTQQFLAAYDAVRPRREPQPEPTASQPAPAPQPKAEPAPAAPEPADVTRLFAPDRAPDDVDRLVDSLTGKLPPLTQAPQPAATHTGFTQDLSAPAPADDTAGFVNNIAQTINSQSSGGDTARFDSAAARLTDTAPDAAEQGTDTFIGLTGLRSKLSLPHLGGTPADESPDSVTQPFDTAELPVTHGHEYERAEDAPAVQSQLDTGLARQTAACLITLAAAAALLTLGILAAALPAMPGALALPSVYPGVALALLAVACAANWRTFVSGLAGFAKTPTPDSLAILPALGALVQCLVLLITKPDACGTLLAGPAALVLLLNAAGKRLHLVTVRDNFALVSAKVDHAVAYRLRDAGALRAVTSGLAEPHPSVLVSRPTQVLRGFLANSAAHGTSDKNQQQFAWLVGIVSLAGGLFTLISTKDAAAAACILAMIPCFCAPLAGTLLSALPEHKMQRSAAQVGAVIPGWRNIRQLGRINVLQVAARDLFPAGCISLVGIKPVKPEHIDLAIVFAASMLSDAEPTLRDVFLNMLGGNRNLLAKVEDRESVYGKGYIGWVRKQRILIGNRKLMQDYGIKIPGAEFEQHHTVNQRRIIYLAVAGKLFAMFQVAYRSDPDTAAVLEGLHRDGHSLLVDCDDFNVDARLLETVYSLPTGSVKVLNTAERNALAPSVAWLPESEGNMLHLGSFASFVGGLEAAAGAAEGERKSAYIVTASVLLSCALSVLFTLTGGLAAMPLPGLVLYQLIWCAVSLAFSVFQRY